VKTNPIRLTTERLLLRTVEERDAAPTAALITPDIAANLSTWPSPMSAERALTKVKESQAMLAAGEGMDWAIVDLAGDPLMGWIGLKLTGEGQLRLGYWIGRAFRNRGFIKEAIGAVVPGGSDFFGVRAVYAQVLKGNLPSVAVLNACGFALTGEEMLYREVVGRSDPCLRFEWNRP
jgi:RimJ/RimL family protein N-acetyltransferase